MNEQDTMLIRIDEKVNGINARLDKLNGATAEVMQKCSQHETDIAILKRQPSAWKAMAALGAFVGLLYTLDKFIF